MRPSQRDTESVWNHATVCWTANVKANEWLPDSGKLPWNIPHWPHSIDSHRWGRSRCKVRNNTTSPEDSISFTSELYIGQHQYHRRTNCRISTWLSRGSKGSKRAMVRAFYTPLSLKLDKPYCIPTRSLIPPVTCCKHGRHTSQIFNTRTVGTSAIMPKNICAILYDKHARCAWA